MNRLEIECSGITPTLENEGVVRLDSDENGAEYESAVVVLTDVEELPNRSGFNPVFGKIRVVVEPSQG